MQDEERLVILKNACGKRSGLAAGRDLEKEPFLRTYFLKGSRLFNVRSRLSFLILPGRAERVQNAVLEGERLIDAAHSKLAAHRCDGLHPAVGIVGVQISC